MKWVIRIFGSIIGLFAIAAIIGFFVPSIITVERSKDIYSQPEDVFDYLSDLDNHEVWSPWRQGSEFQDYIVGGGDEGVGQQAVWTCIDVNCQAGTQEITVLQYPEFVQTELNLDGRSAEATYALMAGENSDGSITVLIKVDLDIGNFPYVQRLFKLRDRSDLETRLDQSLASLVKLIQEDGKSN